MKFNLNTFIVFVFSAVLCGLFAHTSLAATIPTASDVVLVYNNNAALTQSGRYHFLYTVQDDPEIYACEINRCSTAKWAKQGSITMTIYKLPDGFVTGAGLVNPTLLQQYLEHAEQTYVVPNIVTDISTKLGRQFQTVNLLPNGKFTLQQSTYIKPIEQIVHSSYQIKLPTKPSYLAWWVGGGIALVLLGYGIWRLWKYNHWRQLQY